MIKNKIYDKQFFLGVALFLGTLTGVGLFSIPYVALQTNFLTVVFYFVVIGFMIILLNHFYAEISVHSKQNHHLPGHAEKHISKPAKHITAISEGVGLFGAQLAYLIVGGSFLSQLFGLSETNYDKVFVVVFFLIGAFLIWKGIKAVLETDFFMLVIFLFIVFLLFSYALFNNGQNVFELGNGGNIFLPYGVIVFALYGAATIPELTVALKKKEKKINRIIFWSVISAVIIDLVFAWTVLSISGPDTTPETFKGIQGLIPEPLFKAALIFGLITTFTSFLAIGLALKRMFYEDYKVPLNYSWGLVMGIPLLLYFLGFDDFLSAISISGSLGLTISAIIIFTIYIKLKKDRDKRAPEDRIIHHKFFTHTAFVIFLILLAAFGGVASIFFELIK